MPRMEFMNGAQQGVGFIQVGNDLIPAKGELTVSSTGEPSLNISMDYSCGQIEFGFEISHSLNPKQIIFNGSTTTCVFEDDTKYHSRPTIDDDFDPEVGVAMCIMKKLYGSRSKFQEAVAKGYFQEPKKVKPKKAKAKGK